MAVKINKLDPYNNMNRSSNITLGKNSKTHKTILHLVYEYKYI